MALAVLFAVPAQAGLASDEQNIDTACTQEAATANCGNELVGKGLLKCVHAYQKANKSFQVSENCKAAIDTLKAELKSDIQNIAAACTQEAATANCGTDQAGKGLLKCLRTYKKANSSFQLSDGCKTAMSALKNH